jgi:hypothetical protein
MALLMRFIAAFSFLLPLALVRLVVLHDVTPPGS